MVDKSVKPVKPRLKAVPLVHSTPKNEHHEHRRHHIQLALTSREAAHLHNLLEDDLKEGAVHKDHTKAIKSVLAELHVFLPPMPIK